MTTHGAIPMLPAQEIRDALDAGDWDVATGLLTAHETALRDALAEQGDSVQAAPLLALLNAQRAFIEELKGTRDETARALQQFGHDRRGVAAYLGAGSA